MFDFVVVFTCTTNRAEKAHLSVRNHLEGNLARESGLIEQAINAWTACTACTCIHITYNNEAGNKIIARGN